MDAMTLYDEISKKKTSHVLANSIVINCNGHGMHTHLLFQGRLNLPWLPLYKFKKSHKIH